MSTAELIGSSRTSTIKEGLNGPSPPLLFAETDNVYLKNLEKFSTV